MRLRSSALLFLERNKIILFDPKIRVRVKIDPLQ